jgi:hypothetical protein
LLHRPRKWVKTEKTGKLANPNFSHAGETSSVAIETRSDVFDVSEAEIE